MNALKEHNKSSSDPNQGREERRTTQQDNQRGSNSQGDNPEIVESSPELIKEGKILVQAANYMDRVL